MFDHNALFYHRNATKNRAIYLVTVGYSERFRVGDIAVLRLGQDHYWVLEKVRSPSGQTITVEYNDMSAGFVDSFSDAEIVSRGYAMKFSARNSCKRIKTCTLSDLERMFGTLEVSVEPTEPAEIDREFKFLLDHKNRAHHQLLVYITAGRHLGTYAMVYKTDDPKKKWRASRTSYMNSRGDVIRDEQPINVTGLTPDRFRLVDFKTERFDPVPCDTPTGNGYRLRVDVCPRADFVCA